jgi:hypothetical protein
MLDWLSHDQRASYTVSSQILDAPETPAPLFAYRALKSVLFGSHNNEDGDEQEKENIPLEIRSGPGSTKSQSSPLMAKSSTPQRPTPRRILSPAKSILRTPGISTPRCHNVSVKFKDIKQTSVSLSTIAEGHVREDKASLQESKHSAMMPPESNAPTEKALEVSTKPQVLDSDSQPEIYYNVTEINVYIAATEREMKKLVRYGQRMREYARLSQKENATLKRELENVRRENEMLQRREDLKIRGEQGESNAANDGLFDLSPPSKYATTAAARKHPRDEPEATQSTHGGQDQHALWPENAEKMSKKQSLASSIRSRAEEALAPSRSNMAAYVQPVSELRHCVTAKARVCSRTQLPPEKLEAAKARLRMKSEERKKALDMAEQAQKETHGSSAVDWQDL